MRSIDLGQPRLAMRAPTRPPGRSRRHTPSVLDARLQFFNGLTRRELARAAQLFTVFDAAAGRILGREGAPGKEFIVVLTGQVGASVGGEPLAVLGAGHHFGALPLLDPLGASLRRASFHALVRSRLAVANRREFRMLIDELPILGEKVTRLADQRQAYFDGRRDGQRQQTAVTADSDEFLVLLEVAG